MPGLPLPERIPAKMLEQVRKHRLKGWGPDRICKNMPELGKLGVSAKDLGNYLYKNSDHEAIERVQDRLGKLADLLDAKGISADDIGEVKSLRFSEWQSLTKDADGEAQIHDLSGASIVLTPAWDAGPAWPVVQQAKPTIVRPAKASVGQAARSDGWQTALIIPDAQVGFWRDVDTGALDSFHDEKALAAVLRAAKQLKPSLIVLLGDMLDMPEHSRFDQEPGFAMTTQAALDRLHLFLAELRATAPDAEIRYIEGNHDRRLQLSVIRNAKASFGLRQAGTTPESWPVMSLPHLLRLDELGVQYIGGYPAGITWINENLACVHGSKVRSNGSTAAAVIDDERVSVIFGHVHRMEYSSKTRRVYSDSAPGNITAKHSFAASPGCLCRIDGTVPSTKGSTDPFGRPVPAVENWQQGYAVVTFEPGNGRFAYEAVAVYDGEAVLRGKPV